MHLDLTLKIWDRVSFRKLQMLLTEVFIHKLKVLSSLLCYLNFLMSENHVSIRD